MNEREAARFLTMEPLRFGILGAAQIAPTALIHPASEIESAQITRVAARDRGRAEAFAYEHGIGHVADDYEALINADDVDVVYNPLPMSLHAEWSIRALRAGKDVLCEKPLASNATEAAEMVRVAEEEGRILGEAMHYRYHPMFERILDEVFSGRIGDVVRMQAHFNIAIAQPDIRWDYATSGGSTMDLGCYPVHWVRTVAEEEPTVMSATAEVGPEKIDAALGAGLEFPSGVSAYIHSSMKSENQDIRFEIEGTKGSLVAVNPLAPHTGDNNLTIATDRGMTSGPIHAGTTYHHMLRAFIDHVRLGAPFPTKGRDSIANMAVIDAMYEAAGLPVRGT